MSKLLQIKTLIEKLGGTLVLGSDNDNHIGAFSIPKQKEQKMTWEFKCSDKYLIPLERGQAVGHGSQTTSLWVSLGIGQQAGT